MYGGLNHSTARAGNLGLVPEAAQEYTRYQFAAQEALSGEADPAKRAAFARIYQDFLDRYAAYARQSTTQMNAAIAQQMRAQGRVDPVTMQQHAQQMNQAFLARYNSELHQRHGETGREAWSRLHAHMSGPSVFEAVRNNVYNPADARESGSFFGGLRIAGIAGGAIGLLAGLKLFSEYGILGYLATAVMTIGFSYGGNLLQRHFIDGPRRPHDTPELRLDGRSPAAPAGPSLEPGRGAAVAGQAMSAVAGSLPAGITADNVSEQFPTVVPSLHGAPPAPAGRAQPRRP